MMGVISWFLAHHRWSLLLVTLGMGMVALLEVAVIGAVYPLAGMLSEGDEVGAPGGILNQMQVVVEWVPVEDRVLGAVVLVAGMAGLSFLAGTLMDWVVLQFRYRLMEEYVTRVFGRILGYRLDYFQRVRGGEVADHVMNTSHSVGEILLYLPKVGLSLTRIGVTTVLLLSISVGLTVWVYLVVGVLGLLMRWIGKLVADRYSPRLERERTLLLTLCTELAGGIRQIKAFGAEGDWRRSVGHSARRFADGLVKVNLGGVLVKYLGRFLAILFVCGVVGVTRMSDGMAMSTLLPLLAVYLAALMQLMPAVAELGTNWVSMQALRPRLLAAREILEEDDLCEDFSGREVLFEDNISLERVGFDYGNGPVLEEVEMVIRRGENVAVVGESGAGKSTLIDLLFRLHKPKSGTIRVDGVDYREVGLEYWRSQLAMVSQDPVLFHDTVAANILMGNPEAGMEEVRAMARAARADGFIGEMPEGYETMVGERGESLSGGQRQRLAIARALIRRPRLLIMDEATSALDTVTMREMERSIHGLLPETACVFVTHRLWSARLADRIYVLDEGRMVGAGSHEELLADCVVYRRLWAAHEQGEEMVRGV